ncbi:Putative D-alanyl-D-alanine carboxypeptidase [Streptomyces alboniger]
MDRNGEHSADRPAARHPATILPAAVAMTVGLMTPLALVPPAASAAGLDAVQQSLNALVRDIGMPAALASVEDREGRARTYTAGVGDLTTGAKVPRDGQVRIGSNTKTFVAVVVLQLVAERRMSLDAFVDTYLPGLVRGKGIDGRRITVRQLLQHTSGLPEYTSHLGDDARYYAPRELLATALRHPADFDPGKSWKYSNTNYVLAGLIVQKVTARPLADEIEPRLSSSASGCVTPTSPLPVTRASESLTRTATTRSGKAWGHPGAGAGGRGSGAGGQTCLRPPAWQVLAGEGLP